MLKADFHVHTEYSRDSENSPQDIVDRCLQLGINCLAITDHGTTKGAKAVQQIAPFPVIVGEEILSTKGEIIGLFLAEDIPRGLTPLEVVARIKMQGGLVLVPHPFDRVRRSVIRRHALMQVLPHVDILEVNNSRVMFSSDNRKAKQFAIEHKLLMSGGTDAHTIFELGSTCVTMPEFDGTPAGFKQSLALGEVAGKESNPVFHLLSSITKAKRRFSRIVSRKSHKAQLIR